MNAKSFFIFIIVLGLLAPGGSGAVEQGGEKRLAELAGKIGTPQGYIEVIGELPAVLDSIGIKQINNSPRTAEAIENLLEELIEAPVPVIGPDDLNMYNSMGRISGIIDNTRHVYGRILMLKLLYNLYEKMYDLFYHEYREIWRAFRNDELEGAEATRRGYEYDQKAASMLKARATTYTIMLAHLEPTTDRKPRLCAWEFLAEKVDHFPPGTIVQQLAILEKMENLASSENDAEISALASKTINLIRAEQIKYPESVGKLENKSVLDKNIRTAPLPQPDHR